MMMTNDIVQQAEPQQAETQLAEPLFSLILCTYGGGFQHVERLLQSLLRQGDESLELIVVDQNADDRLVDLLKRYEARLSIQHIRTAPGLSSARNVGIRAARGRIFAFPDDDCWYPAGHLGRVRSLLDDGGNDGLTCRCTDEQGNLAAGGEDRRSGRLTKWNVWNRGVSATLFLTRDLVSRIGFFDEDLGLGARSNFQSGEETDYLLRSIAHGMNLRYEPDLSVYHPLPPPSRQAGAVRKSWQYGLGMGRVLAKHRYSRLQVYWFLVVPVLGALKALCSGDLALARVRATRTMARYRGWRWRPQQTITLPPWQLH
jgi:glycosyltransferase involved in cell wall biosynthesis